MQTRAKMKAVLERIKRFEEAINKGREYLETGNHANWEGFRPLFDAKVSNGKEAPPHKDWVKSFFIPRAERALAHAEKTLQRLEREMTERAKGKR
jgi:hypothetical protein